MVVELRRTRLFRHVDVSRASGLEVGAYYNPTVRPSEGDVRFLDFHSQEELEAARDVKRPADAEIGRVDYVVKSDDYYRHVPERFDYVIANHVFEHVDNPVQWVIDLGRLLRPRGVLFLAVPDKKYNFDRLRSDTPLSHLLADYFRGHGEPAEHGVELALGYDTSYVGEPLELGRALALDRLRAAFAEAPHPGRHNHVFQSESFVARILRPLQFAGLWPFTLLEFGDAKENGGEFHLVLREGRERVELDPRAFYGPAFGRPFPGGADLRRAVLEERIAELEAELAALRAALGPAPSEVPGWRRVLGRARRVRRNG